ncbi:MAG: S8 family peptidase [Saprospiraceae bacterium]|nr:S8 family peptidase [Saprospiraceae bacterium]
MYKTTVTTLLLFLLLGSLGVLDAQSDHHSNHLLIKFDPSASYQEINSLRTSYHADELWVSHPSDMRLWVVNFSSFNPFSNIHEVVQNAKGKPKVKSVGLDVILELDYITNNSDFQMQVPDPLYPCEQSVFNIRPKTLPTPISQDAGFQAEIAIIDAGGPFSGIEYPILHHGSYFDNFVDLNDIGGDIFEWDDIPNDQNGHGIHTGGIVALENLLGPEVETNLRFYRAFNQEGTGSLGDVIRSIDHAVEAGTHVINCSFGYVIPDGANPSNNPPLREVIDVARVHNVLFVAAAGNDEQDNDELERATYPASFNLDNIISVAAADCEGQLADFSNSGQSTVDLAAPGVHILSTYLGSTWAIKSGTSQAAPFVTYVAGLLAAIAPFDYQEVKCAILDGVQENPDFAQKLRTSGILDGPGAMTAFMEGCSGGSDDGRRKTLVLPQEQFIQGVFPNPSKGDFRVALQLQEAGPIRLQILSPTGQLIQESEQRLEAGSQLIDLQLATNLPQGVYLLKIHGSNGSGIKKLIKQ